MAAADDVVGVTFHDPGTIHLTFHGGGEVRRDGTIWDAAEVARAAHLTIAQVTDEMVRWEWIGGLFDTPNTQA